MLMSVPRQLNGTKSLPLFALHRRPYGVGV
jgi:hypothetical protein